MQATMLPVPIPMFSHSASAQTAIASGSAASHFGVPLLRQPSTASLFAPSPRRLVRQATAPEPRTYTPHPSRNKRKASFHELSPEVAERPSKRPKVEQTSSGPDPKSIEKAQKNASCRASLSPPRVPTPEMPPVPPESPVKSDSLLYLEAQRAKLSTMAIPEFMKQDKLAGRQRWERAQCDIHAHPRRTGRPARQLPSLLSGAPRVPGTWSNAAVGLPHPQQDTAQIRCAPILHNARTRRDLVYDPAKPRTTPATRLARWTMFPQGKHATPDLRRTCTLLAFGVDGGAYMKSAGVRIAWIKHEAMYGRAKECDEDAETEILDNEETSLDGSAWRRAPPVPFVEETDQYNDVFALRQESTCFWSDEVDESGDVIMAAAP